METAPSPSSICTPASVSYGDFRVVVFFKEWGEKAPSPLKKKIVYRALSLRFMRQDAFLSVSIMCMHGLAFH